MGSRWELCHVACSPGGGRGVSRLCHTLIRVYTVRIKQNKLSPAFFFFFSKVNSRPLILSKCYWSKLLLQMSFQFVFYTPFLNICSECIECLSLQYQQLPTTTHWRHFISLVRTSRFVASGASSGGDSCATAGESGASNKLTHRHLPHYGDIRHRHAAQRKSLLAPHTCSTMNWYPDDLALSTAFEHIQISPVSEGFHI